MERRIWDELVERLVREGILRSPRIVQAFRKVPRDLFIPERMRPHAAVDTPLPIGYGQTISAPHS